MINDCKELYVIECEMTFNGVSRWELVERSSFTTNLETIKENLMQHFKRTPNTKFRLVRYSGEVIDAIHPYRPTQKVYYQVEKLTSLNWEPVFAKLQDVQEALKFLDYLKVGAVNEQYRLIEHRSTPLTTPSQQAEIPQCQMPQGL